MAKGAGFFLQSPDEPSIFISGETVYSEAVERVLTQLHPDLAVVAAGHARLDVGRSILMPLEEVFAFIRTALGKVIANHLEALNHCPVTRAQLQDVLDKAGLLIKTIIPQDGETLTMAPD
jgi:L-ascorbate metabolism protein UlaG (beta-lactamase superfamily)